MGIIKDVNINLASKYATEAAAAGRRVFVYRQNVPLKETRVSGPISVIAEVVEAIESTGWTLAEMNYDGADHKNGAVLLLFRAASNGARHD